MKKEYLITFERQTRVVVTAESQEEAQEAADRAAESGLQGWKDLGEWSTDVYPLPSYALWRRGEIEFTVMNGRLVPIDDKCQCQCHDAE